MEVLNSKTIREVILIESDETNDRKYFTPPAKEDEVEFDEKEKGEFTK